MSVVEVANVLRRRLGDSARRVPTRVLPNFMVRVASIFDAPVRQIVPELGKPKNATNAKAKKVLGWEPRSTEESIVATAESLLRLGLLKESPKLGASASV
jgi:dihydroflavonol-4-reductase